MKGEIRKFTIGIFLVLFALGGCAKKSYYDQVVQRELATGIRKDSLFLGFKLGMTSQEFYSHAWELNKKHLVTNSSSNMAVIYNLDSLNGAAKMDFYPRFYKNKIYLMPVQISYDGWAPWNKRFSADTLEVHVLQLFHKWYGAKFFKVIGPHGEIAHVNVNGNRRITVLKHNSRVVDVLFTDLIAERERNKSMNASKGFWGKIKSWF